MSQEKVEIIHRLAAAVGRRDTETLIQLTSPEVEWHTSLSVISEGGAYHGHDGVRRYVTDLEDAFKAFDAHIDDVLVVGDSAVAVGHVRYHGKASGVEQVQPLGWAVRFEGDRATYLRAFRDPEQALEAVGLRE
jgi:ketosteroid isomerase-like protein